MPTIIAMARRHANAMPIFLVNLLLGWAYGLGWLVALIWSFTSNVRPREPSPVLGDPLARAHGYRDSYAGVPYKHRLFGGVTAVADGVEQSYPNWEAFRRAVDAARETVNARGAEEQRRLLAFAEAAARQRPPAPAVRSTDPFHTNPLYGAARRFYPSAIVGLPYAGPDGVPRARSAAGLSPGDQVELILDPDNARNPDAVAVWWRGRHLGFLPSRHDWVTRALGRGEILVALVTDVDLEDGVAKSVDLDILIMQRSGRADGT